MMPPDVLIAPTLLQVSGYPPPFFLLSFLPCLAAIILLGEREAATGSESESLSTIK